MGKHTATWKAHERATARLLGGQRVGPTGRPAPDVVSDWAAVECKSRKTLPAWLKDAVAQSEAAAISFTSPRLPVTVLHEVGGRHADDLCVMPMSAFAAWFGEWRDAQDD